MNKDNKILIKNLREKNGCYENVKSPAKQ